MDEQWAELHERPDFQASASSVAGQGRAGMNTPLTSLVGGGGVGMMGGMTNCEIRLVHRSPQKMAAWGPVIADT